MDDELVSVVQKYSTLLVDLIKNELLPFDSKEFRKLLPQAGGVYRIVEKRSNPQETVYIGQSNNIQNRVYRSHLMGSQQVSTLKRKLIRNGMFSDENLVKKYFHEECAIQYVILADELERISFEHFAVSILKPKFND